MRLQFEFSVGGAYHPSGFGQWQISLTEDGSFYPVHHLRDERIAYGPFTLVEAENEAVWRLIEAAAISRRPETFQRLGLPDETAYIFSLTESNTTDTVEIWADDAAQDEALAALVTYLETLLTTYVQPSPPFLR